MSAPTIAPFALRRSALLARIRRARGQWTRARAAGFYARNVSARLRPAEVRADLAALHAAGHLARHETPGRLSYTFNAAGGGRS